MTQSRDPATSPLRFLFLFSDTGGGHRASASAVRDEMYRLYGETVAVEMVDIFVETGRWPFDRFPRWYPLVVKFKGIPWGINYHLTDHKILVKFLSRLGWHYARDAWCDVLRRHPADVIVSYHGIPNYTLQSAHRYLGLRSPFAIVALDLVNVHAAWFAPGADLYIVPTEKARARAVRWGTPSKRLGVIGMPTRRSFVESSALSRSAARERLGLPADRDIVLIVGGGEGMGPLARTVKAIAERRPPAHLVAITGRNRALRDELTALDLPIPLQVEGFVSDMEVWMRAADLLVTKAGPNTLCEAFIAGLPLILYTALPGQEEGNVEYVTDNGAGLWAPRPQQTAQAVLRLLTHPAERAAMAAQSQSLARPHAAELIARSLWQLHQEVGAA